MAGNAMLLPHRIYLSHAAADRAFATSIADRLRARGVAVLTDSDVEAGRRWSEAIEIALARANACLVLVSKASNPSDPATSTEWARIQDTIWRRPDLKVLPVVVGEVETPTFLRRWQALRLPQPPDPEPASDCIVDALSHVEARTPELGDEDIERTGRRFGEIRDSLAGMKNPS